MNPLNGQQDNTLEDEMSLFEAIFNTFSCTTRQNRKTKKTNRVSNFLDFYVFFVSKGNPFLLLLIKSATRYTEFLFCRLLKMFLFFLKVTVKKLALTLTSLQTNTYTFANCADPDELSYQGQHC